MMHGTIDIIKKYSLDIRRVFPSSLPSQFSAACLWRVAISLQTRRQNLQDLNHIKFLGEVNNKIKCESEHSFRVLNRLSFLFIWQHKQVISGIFINIEVKVRVKVTLVEALRLCTGSTAHRGSRGIVLPFHDHGTRRRWGVSFTPRPLFTPGKSRYPLYRRPCGPQGRSGQVRKISPPHRDSIPGPSSP